MPVAIKLSKRFYDTFGQEVTDEFVDALNVVDASYRAEFRELFGAHFGQLRAEVRADLDKLASELRAEMDKLGTELRADMDRLATELRAEMDKLATELRAEMNQLATELRTEMKQMETRMEARFALQDGRMDTFQEKIRGDLKAMKSDLVGWMVGIWLGTVALAIVARLLGI